MNKYVIVNIINSQETHAQFSSKDWPLHLTLLTHFTTNKPESLVIEAVGKCVNKHSAFETAVEGEDLFGINSDIPVSVLKLNEPLLKLHTDLMNTINALGGVYDSPSHVGRGFKPHVTTLKGVKHNAATPPLVNTVTLAEIIQLEEGKLIRIVRTFDLKS